MVALSRPELPAEGGELLVDLGELQLELVEALGLTLQCGIQRIDLSLDVAGSDGQVVDLGLGLAL